MKYALIGIVVIALTGGFIYFLNQQSEIDALKREIDILKQTQKTSNDTVSIPQPIATPVKTVDPTLKIEKCRAEAKLYAESTANSLYAKAAQDALNKGDTKSAALFMLSKPTDYTNYQNNYDTTYFNCLNK